MKNKKLSNSMPIPELPTESVEYLHITTIKSNEKLNQKFRTWILKQDPIL